MKEYAVIVDIAKKRDYTAIMVMRDSPEVVTGKPILNTSDRVIHFFDIAHIEMFQGLTYPEIIERVQFIMDFADIRNNADLVIDGTGVGEAPVDLLRASGFYPNSIVFTGGTQVRFVYSDVGGVFKGAPGQLLGAQTVREIHVPKADLVSAGVVILQQGRLRVAPSLRWAEAFRKQLEAFRGKVNEKTNRIAYEAKTEADHDDLVVCYLMGCWWFRNRKGSDEIPEQTMERELISNDWDPFNFI